MTGGTSKGMKEIPIPVCNNWTVTINRQKELP